MQRHDLRQRHDLWFHIDAAYAGSACICPEFRHYINGVEDADSFNINAHKWLLTNFDCHDKHPFQASQGNLVVDYKDWQIPLGRRFRSLKLWMVLRLYGLENLQAYIRNHVELAKRFEELISQDSRFEVVTPRKFSLVCFRLLPPPEYHQIDINRLNHDLLDAINSTGKVFLSHTVLSGIYVLRFAIGAPLTEERHILEAWKVLQDEASALLKLNTLT
ncbi:decarboxylase [Lithospermum erythrorhizon]|uniref:Decarboxylase n=1 Tax=Lithospermum erythrorhizon TaxID=34254 RepID=A0AAV3QR84_LITER